MSELETYGPQRVGPEGIGSVRVNTQMSAEAAGGGPLRDKGAELAQELGNNMSKMAGIHEHMANQVIQQEAENHADQALNETVYGKQDEKGNLVQKGLRQYTGGNVTQIGQDGADLKGGLSKRLDEIQAGLPNDRVKANFEAAKRERLARFDNEARPWAMRQLDEHDKAVTQDAINTYTMDGVANANKALDPGSRRMTGPDGTELGPPLNPVDYNAAKLHTAILDSARRRGLTADDPEVKDQMVGAMGQFHQNVISEMLRNNRPDMAREYLKEHSKELLPAHYEALGERIDEKGVDAHAESVAAHVLRQTGGGKDGVGMVAQMDLPEKVKHKAMGMVREGISAQEEMKDLDQQRAIEAAEQKRGGSAEPLEKYLDPTTDFSKKNLDAIKYLNAPTNPPKSDRGALKSFQNVQKGAGFLWFGNHQNGLRTMDRSTLLTQYISKVSPNTAKFMMAAWKESQQGKTDGPANRTFNQHADNLDSIHAAVPNSAVNGEDAYYQHPAVAAAAKDGRMMTADESKQAVKDTTLKAYRSGPADTAFQAKSDVKAWMDIPLGHRKALENLPGIAGKVLADGQKELLRQAYNATKAGNTKAAKDFYQQATDWKDNSDWH